jgi:hypothetical protein
MTGREILVALALVAFVTIFRTAVVVPQQSVCRRAAGPVPWGPQAGFHVLLPFVDSIRYRHSLKKSPSTSPRRSASRATTSRSVSTAFCISVLSPERASQDLRLPFRHHAAGADQSAQ